LVGPPGVGKTTFAKVMAQVLGKPFFILPLGGESDSSTLLGSKPESSRYKIGQISKFLIEGKKADPLILLDEIYKTSTTLHNNLIHLLDPEQNQTIHERCLETELDFSKITLAIVNNDGNSSDHLSRYTGVTSLKNELYNRSVDVPEMMQILLEKLEHYYLKLESEGPENIRNEWEKRADTLGKVVKVREQNEIVEGIATGIDVDGILLVKTHDGSVHRLI
jgi:ATP-dependent Lon protease